MSFKRIYLFSVSFVSLFIILFAATVLLDRQLKVWVFPLGDQPNYSYPCMTPISPAGTAIICNQAAIDGQRKLDQEEHAAQSDPTQAIIVIAIAVPMWWFHWRQAKQEVV